MLEEDEGKCNSMVMGICIHSCVIKLHVVGIL